jgi:hypothetical protein
MPFDLSPFQLAEGAIWIAGIFIILATAVALWGRNAWRSTFHLSAGPQNDVESTDLLIAFCFFLVLSSLFYDLFGWLALTGPAPSPTTSPAPEHSLNPQRMLAVAAAQLTNVVIFALLGRARFQQGLAGWGLTLRGTGANIVRAVVAYVALWPVCSGLLVLATWLLRFIPGYVLQEHDALLALRSAGSPTWAIVLTIVSAMVLAPLVEELLFRGLVQPALARKLGSEWKAILWTGLFFGLIHVPLYQTMPALVFFGIVLGYAYAKTRSLTLVILIHAVFNAKTILWSLLGATAT